MSKIAELNDQFRKTFDQRLGGVILTHAVAELHFTVQMSIIEAVKSFNAFTQDIDPHGEHAFGEFELAGEWFWRKIDYCDPNRKLCTENPADPDYGNRLLTIMFADEYWNRFLHS